MKSLTKQTAASLMLSASLLIASCSSKNTDPTPVVPPNGVSGIAIGDLKKLSTSAAVTLPDNEQISGVVISDVTNKNIDPKTVILQETTGKSGIVISFDAAQTFAAGDSLTVNVSKQTLAQVNGEIVLNNVPAANAVKKGSGTIVPQKISAENVIKNAAALDGTLVMLSSGSFAGGSGKYTGTLTYTDISGTVKSLVLAGASFENKSYVLSADSVVGIVRVNGSDNRVDIRNTSDVFSGITKTISEDFSTATAGTNNDFTTTPTGNWLFGVNAGESSVLIPPFTGDDFLKAGGKYIYVVKPLSGMQSATIAATGGMLTTGYEGQLSGLKNVSVTFAGSNFSGEVTYELPHLNPRPFNASTDKSGVAVYLCTPYSDNGGGLAVQIGSAAYSDAGVLHTFNVKIPATVQELYNLILAEGGVDKDLALVYANDYFNSGKIIVGFSTISTNREETVGYYYAPNVVTNVTFGLGN